MTAALVIGFERETWRFMTVLIILLILYAKRTPYEKKK